MEFKFYQDTKKKLKQNELMILVCSQPRKIKKYRKFYKSKNRKRKINLMLLID